MSKKCVGIVNVDTRVGAPIYMHMYASARTNRQYIARSTGAPDFSTVFLPQKEIPDDSVPVLDGSASFDVEVRIPFSYSGAGASIDLAGQPVCHRTLLADADNSPARTLTIAGKRPGTEDATESSCLDGPLSAIAGQFKSLLVWRFSMSISKLEQSEWHRYFDRMSKALDGKQAEIEVDSLSIGAQGEGKWLTLHGIVYDQKDNIVEILLEGVDRLVHRPKEIYVDQDALALKSVEVIDEDDVRQIVRLRDPLMLSAP